MQPGSDNSHIYTSTDINIIQLVDVRKLVSHQTTLNIHISVLRIPRNLWLIYIRYLGGLGGFQLN